MQNNPTLEREEHDVADLEDAVARDADGAARLDGGPHAGALESRFDRAPLTAPQLCNRFEYRRIEGDHDAATIGFVSNGTRDCRCGIRKGPSERRT